MVEQLSTCPSCGTPFGPRPGPGRPGVYCGESCRRLAEFELRLIARRLDKSICSLRALQAEGASPPFDLEADERRRKMRALRKWIAEDQERLRALLGGRDE